MIGLMKTHKITKLSETSQAKCPEINNSLGHVKKKTRGLHNLILHNIVQARRCPFEEKPWISLLDGCCWQLQPLTYSTRWTGLADRCLANSSHHCKPLKSYFWPITLTVMHLHTIKLFSVHRWRCLLLEDKFSTKALGGRCAFPDPVMKAFRCLEMCHFPQLWDPCLHSDEPCLYHSQAYQRTSLISASRYKFQI